MFLLNVESESPLSPFVALSDEAESDPGGPGPNAGLAGLLSRFVPPMTRGPSLGLPFLTAEPWCPLCCHQGCAEGHP